MLFNQSVEKEYGYDVGGKNYSQQSATVCVCVCVCMIVLLL